MADELLVSLLGLLRHDDLMIAQDLDVVGVGRTRPIAFLQRRSRLQFHRAGLVGDQSRPCPLVIRALGQEMPAEHRQLASHGDGGDLVATAGANAQEERPQRSRRLGRRPGRLDQQGPGMGASPLADAAILGEPKPGLVNPRIEPDVAHQLLRAVEAMDITDRGNQPGGDGEVDAGDRQKPSDRRIITDGLGNLAVEPLQVLAQAIKFAQVASMAARSSSGSG